MVTLKDSSQVTPKVAASPPVTTAPPAEDDVIDVKVLFSALWRGSWFILLLALVGAYVGYRDIRNFVPQYLASSIVAPSTGSMGGFSGGSSGGLSGIARSLGLSGMQGGGRATTFDRLVLLTSSVTLAEYLQGKYGLLQRIYKDSWDPDGKTWVRPKGEGFERDQKIRKFLNLRMWSEPDVESLARAIEAVKIEPMEGSGFYRISYAHTDADFALFILETVYNEADDMLRRQDQFELVQRKAYLEQQLRQASMVETRLVLADLLTAEERTAMLLENELPYAARIIEPPFVSSTPTSASVTKSFVVPVAVAVTIGVFLVLLIALYRRE